jgi:Protein of unknown function DUF262
MRDEQVLLRLPTPTHAQYANLLNDIENGEIKIPQFQRDFVWSVQKSAALIDSVVKGYPIGTFIFWATKDRLRSVKDTWEHQDAGGEKGRDCLLHSWFSRIT